MHPKYVLLCLLPALELASATPIAAHDVSVLVHDKRGIGSFFGKLLGKGKEPHAPKPKPKGKKPGKPHGSSSTHGGSGKGPNPDKQKSPGNGVVAPKMPDLPGGGKAHASKPKDPKHEGSKDKGDEHQHCKRMGGCGDDNNRAESSATGKRKNQDRPKADRAPVSDQKPPPKEQKPDEQHPDVSNLPYYDPKKGFQLQHQGGAREHAAGGQHAGQKNWHHGNFKTGKGFDEEAFKKAMSQQGGHLTQKYKDGTYKKGEMPGDLTGAHSPHRDPNDPDCHGILCMHTSEVKKGGADKDQNANEPQSVKDQQTNPKAQKEGAHGETGTMQNMRHLKGIKDKDPKTGQPGKLPDGTRGGSLNLPNGASKKDLDPAHVVPHKACDGQKKCDHVMDSSNVEDIWRHKQPNQVKPQRENAQPWDPNGFHSWVFERRAVVLKRALETRRRAVLRRALDDFLAGQQEEEELARREAEAEAEAETGAEMGSWGSLSARAMGLGVGVEMSEMGSMPVLA